MTPNRNTRHVLPRSTLTARYPRLKVMVGFSRRLPPALAFGVEFISGVLLLANPFVTLATVLLGTVIANVLMFHIAMLFVSKVPGISRT